MAWVDRSNAALFVDSSVTWSYSRRPALVTLIFVTPSEK